MNALEKNLIAQIINSRAIQPAERLLLAVSGGADSTAMLILVAEHFAAQVGAAVYVNHLLRPAESAHEQAHVQALCQSYQLPFQAVAVDVPGQISTSADSPESAARRLRYQALEDSRKKWAADKILVAHTADDQVEEFLIRMIRGTGIKGLAGMQARSNRLVRPLLTVNKKQLIGFLADKGVSWCYDRSNDDRSLLRNRVRHELLPFLREKFNPAINQNLGKLMSIAQAEEDYISHHAAHSYQQVATDQARHAKTVVRLTRQTFNAVHRALQRRIVETACWQLGCRPSFRTISAIVGQSVARKSGSEIHLRQGVVATITETEIILKRYPAFLSQRRRTTGEISGEMWLQGYGLHTLSTSDQSIRLEKAPATPSSEPTHLLDGKCLQFPLLIRAARPGERMTPLGAPGSKKVAKILSDKKIPRTQRPRHPVLISDSKIIALLGICTSESSRITDQTTEIIEIHWQQR